MTSPANPGTARNRFFIIQFARLGGIAVMLFGIVIWHGNLLTPGGNMPVGLALTLLGILESVLLPKILARRWRSPRS